MDEDPVKVDICPLFSMSIVRVIFFNEQKEYNVDIETLQMD